MGLLSSYYGSISSILLGQIISTNRHSLETNIQKNVGGFLRALPAGIKLYLPIETDENIPSSIECMGSEVFPIRIENNSPKGLWNWPQDKFLVLEAPLLTFLLPKGAEDKMMDWATYLGKYCGAKIKQADFWFEGGNILRLGDVCLAGIDQLYENRSTLGYSVHSLERAMNAAFGTKDIIWVGNERLFTDRISGCKDKRIETRQPFFHIDLFLIPGVSQANGETIIFAGEMEGISEMINAKPRLAKDLLKINSHLEATINQLKRALPHTVIERLPMPAFLNGKTLITPTYCNGLAETRNEDTHWFLPRYDNGSNSSQRDVRFKQYQSNILQKASNFRIQTHFVEMDFLSKIHDCGSLHCMVKVLSRST